MGVFKKTNWVNNYGKGAYSYDAKRKAKPPGKRTSRTGTVYYEYRVNRSDSPEEIKKYQSWSTLQHKKKEALARKQDKAKVAAGKRRIAKQIEARKKKTR